MTRIGICAPKSAMKSKPSGPDERIEAVGAELADLGLELGHAPRREGTRQQAAVDGVGRRVLEDDHARGDVDVRLDDLEDGALARDVRLRVEESLLHVLEPADRQEVVGVVVVERRLFAQPSVHGIRVSVDLDAVHVVVDVVAHVCLHELGRRRRKVRVRLRREYRRVKPPRAPGPYGGADVSPGTWRAAGWPPALPSRSDGTPASPSSRGAVP